MLGVASGDPDETSVALWTRLIGDVGADDVELRWEIATDDTFAELVASGATTAAAGYAHSVHVVADGLEPGSRYAYRFRSGDGVSPVGATRTAPRAGDPTALRLAVASCQRFSDGYYAAHRDIAAADLDVVLFLGDFVYETIGAGTRDLPGRGSTEPATTLDGYRLRYEAARSDPDHMAADAAHPWIVTWDDHEVVDDYDGTTVDADRRALAYQAWWEHQPTRLAAPVDGRLDVHRSIRWGSTAELVVLDCRQHRVVGETMLGPDQLAWALATIGTSSTGWTVLASSVVFSPVSILGNVNDDAWDGFAAERNRLAAALVGGSGSPLALAGDVHVEVVLQTPGERRIPELVCPSISSGVGDLGEFVARLPALVPNVEHAKDVRGWLRVDLREQRATARYREVVDVEDPQSPVVDGPTFELPV